MLDLILKSFQHKNFPPLKSVISFEQQKKNEKLLAMTH